MERLSYQPDASLVALAMLNLSLESGHRSPLSPIQSTFSPLETFQDEEPPQKQKTQTKSNQLHLDIPLKSHSTPELSQKRPALPPRVSSQSAMPTPAEHHHPLFSFFKRPKKQSGHQPHSAPCGHAGPPRELLAQSHRSRQNEQNADGISDSLLYMLLDGPIGADAADRIIPAQSPSTSFEDALPLADPSPLADASLVPPHVEAALTALEALGTQTEGLYRVPGAQSTVDSLRSYLLAHPSASALLDSDNHRFKTELFDNDINAVASLLKAFLRKGIAGEPICTHCRYPAFVRAAALSDEKSRLAAIHDVVLTLPPTNFSLLERIIRHLAFLAPHATATKMHAKNLAIVFGPTLFCEPPFVYEQSINPSTIDGGSEPPFSYVKRPLDPLELIARSAKDAPIQTLLVETLILHSSWIFAQKQIRPLPAPPNQSDPSPKREIDPAFRLSTTLTSFMSHVDLSFDSSRSN